MSKFKKKHEQWLVLKLVMAFLMVVLFGMMHSFSAFATEDVSSGDSGVSKPDVSDWDDSKKIYAYSWDDDVLKKLDIVLDNYPEFKPFVEYVNLGVASEESLEMIDASFTSNKYPSLIPADIGSAKYWIDDYSKTLVLSQIGLTDDVLGNSYQYAKDFGTCYGDLKAVTWQSTAGSVFYNKAIARDTFGTDDPVAIQEKLKDWDSFFAAAEKLKAKNYKIVSGPKDVYYAIINAHTEPWVIRFSEDTEVFKPDSAIRTYIETAKRLVDGGYTNGTEMWDGEWADSMKDGGNVFCYFGCPWMVGVFQGNGASDGSWGTCVGPQPFYWGGTYVSVGKDTPNPELCAFLLYELTCDPEIGVQLTNETGDVVNNIAANKRLADGEIADDNNAVQFFGGQNPYITWAEASEGIQQSAVRYTDKYYEGYISIAAEGYSSGLYSTVEEALDYIRGRSYEELGILSDEYATEAPEIKVNTNVTGSINSKYDYDWYKIKVSQAGVIKIRFDHQNLRSSNRYWYISIYDKDFNNIAGDTNCWYINGNGTSYTLPDIGLPAGTYYILVESGDYTSDTNYKMNVGFTPTATAEKEYNGDRDSANPIELNTAYSGSLFMADDVDWYKFVLTKSGLVTISFGHENLDSDYDCWRVYLANANGDNITLGSSAYYDIDTKGTVTVLPQKSLSAGTYYLLVMPATYTSDSTYSIKVGFAVPVEPKKEEPIVNTTGWKKSGSNWIYQRSNGTYPKKQWEKIGNKWYYFDANGYSATGWKKVGKNWYYFSPAEKTHGQMQIGWKQVGKKWYFFKKDGAMAANEWCQGYWLNKDGTWTYKKKATWKKDKKSWWFGCKGWYAKSKWQKIDDKWYYFDAKGYITTGTKKIGKKTYKFNKSGACLNP